MTRDLPTLGMLSLSITHELRQPLSLIVGYAELLATRQLSEAQRTSMLGAVREAAADRRAGRFGMTAHAPAGAEGP